MVDRGPHFSTLSASSMAVKPQARRWRPNRGTLHGHRIKKVSMVHSPCVRLDARIGQADCAMDLGAVACVAKVLPSEWQSCRVSPCQHQLCCLGRAGRE